MRIQDFIDPSPLIFKPYLKGVIWGGEKICGYKNIEQPESNIGESWEISAVPGHESIVAEGIYKDLTLQELSERFGVSLLGEKVVKKYGKKFPLLIKIIDAADNLSVQVHPNDNLAQSRHGSLGKTEMWYIIDAEKEAKIYVGFKVGMTPEEYTLRVENGTFFETLAVHDVVPGDVFFLPAGRVHAIGAGNLLAEIQESSDITYRIYDYNRKDKEGNCRELHTSLAKDAIDYKVYPYYKLPHLSEEDDNAELVSCEHFTTRRLLLKGETEMEFNSDSFTVLMCIKGKVELSYPRGKMGLKEGSTVLVPASLNKIGLRGEATLLLCRVGS